MTLNPTLRRLGLALAIVGLLYAFGLAVYNSRQRLSATTFNPPRALASAHTSLLTANGSITLHQLKGNLVLLFIGYTNCPDYCPNTLSSLRRAISLLTPQEATQVKVLFISVDPQRDPPEKLAAYATAFNPAFMGALVASQPELDALVAEIGAYYELGQPDQNGFYAVEHSTNLMVLNRAGELAAFWGYGTQPANIAADLRLLLRQQE